MDFETIKLHYDWFKAESQSWTELGTSCQAIADALNCANIENQHPSIFGAVYDAYDSMRAAFTSEDDADGCSYVGYRVGAVRCAQVSILLIDTAKTYARQAAQDAEDLARVEKMLQG